MSNATPPPGSFDSTVHEATIAPRGSLPPGTVVDNKYVIVRVLGEGGMGIVYLARDKNIGVDVVLKAVRAELAHRSDVRERTLAEGQALARIDHPNVVRFNAVIVEGPMLWLVMQYIEGEGLDQRIERLARSGQLLPLDEALRIFKQICQGVGAAHKEGLIHRDLKPANVLLRGKDGVAKVSDFGIAKGESDAREGKGQTKGIIGSLWYMSPEQVRGRRDLDKRVDIYALGVVLFEMLSGRVPFDADSQFEVMRLHAEEPIPPVAALRRDVPPAIDQIILRATAKDRDYRYGSCEELLAAVEALSRAPGPAAWPAQFGAAPGGDPTVAAAMPAAAAWPSGPSVAAGASGSGPIVTAAMPIPPAGMQDPTVLAHPGPHGPGAPHTTTGGQALPPMYAPPPPRPQLAGSKLPMIVLGAGAAALIASLVAYKISQGSDDEPVRHTASNRPTDRGAPTGPTATTATPPASGLAALGGKWQVKDSPKRLEAVMSGDALEFRVVDPAQFGGADYRAGDARFGLKLLPGETGTFAVEDHLRPLPPVGFHFGEGSRSTCQVAMTTAHGQPLRARFDGARLDIELGAISPEPANFTVSGNAVSSCRGLADLKTTRVSATLVRP